MAHLRLVLFNLFIGRGPPTNNTERPRGRDSTPGQAAQRRNAGNALARSAHPSTGLLSKESRGQDTEKPASGSNGQILGENPGRPETDWTTQAPVFLVFLFLLFHCGTGCLVAVDVHV